MMPLLELREKLRTLYAKYDRFITVAVKFLLMVCALFLISTSIGYKNRMNHPAILLGIAFLCAWVPYELMAITAGAMVLIHISSVSLEMAVILAAAFFLIAILYYGFDPGDAYLLLVTPIAWYLKIPYVIPILVGLSGIPVNAIPVGCATMIYYLLQYVNQNAGVLAKGTSGEILQKFMMIFKVVINNKEMFINMAAMMAAVIVVYLIRTASADYAWQIAIAAGVIAQLVIVFAGNLILDIQVDMILVFVGMIISALLALVYNFFVFAVDYSRTEYLTFEDDDYCYYVKAVPKIAVTEHDVKVQKISSTRTRKNPSKEKQ